MKISKKHLKKLLKLDGWKRRLYFVGILTKELEKFDIRPIVVGGHAVEFYTLGGYITADIDLVMPYDEKIDKVFKNLGFKKVGRHWDSDKLDIAVESPASRLEGDYVRIKEVEIEDLKVYLIGLEDIIIDRLNAYKWWQSLSDGEIAEKLIKLHKSKIDWKYLAEVAAKNKLSDVIKKYKKKQSRKM